MLDAGCSMLDARYGMLDSGYWIKRDQNSLERVHEVGIDRVTVSCKSSLGSPAKAGGRQRPIQFSRDAGFLEIWMGSRLRGNDFLLVHGIIVQSVLSSIQHLAARNMSN